MKTTLFTPKYTNPELSTEISPEVLAAIFARFSRSEDGLEKILKTLNDTPSEKFQDAVWKWLDYGHASIGGLTGGIPIGVDKISMLIPYLAFFNQSKQDGQETSTRYVEFKPEGLEPPQSFGIPEQFHQRWYKTMLSGFEINEQLTKQLDATGKLNPELARIPKDANEKVKTRMLKNFGFDRSRYVLPLAGLTNFGMIMTAREWAQTIQYLDSFDLPCSKELGSNLRTALSAVAPQLMKHSSASQRTLAFANDFLDRAVEYLIRNGINTENVSDQVSIDLHTPRRSPFIHPESTDEQLIERSFSGKKNRYDFARGQAEKMRISIYWNNMAIAETRDVNRQRPCKKDTLLAPIGFYMPDISIKEMKRGDGKLYEQYSRFLEDRARLMKDILHSKNPRAYAGCLLLGDQTPFELHTTGDHFAYMAELRTGMGAHFRYDDHFRQAYEKLAKQNPSFAKQIKLGTGEPE